MNKLMAVVIATLLSGLAASARADTYQYTLYCNVGASMSMQDAGCGTNGCEHHDCSEGVCYSFYAWKYTSSVEYPTSEGKVSETVCGTGPISGAWCDLWYRHCKQAGPGWWETASGSYTQAETVVGSGAVSIDAGSMTYHIGRCNGPDTAPSSVAAVESGACWGTCTDGTCSIYTWGGATAWYTATQIGSGGGGGPDSCEGNCGSYAGACWCDDWCTYYGDCCADACSVCGEC